MEISPLKRGIRSKVTDAHRDFFMNMVMACHHQFQGLKLLLPSDFDFETINEIADHFPQLIVLIDEGDKEEVHKYIIKYHGIFHRFSKAFKNDENMTLQAENFVENVYRLATKHLKLLDPWFDECHVRRMRREYADDPSDIPYKRICLPPRYTPTDSPPPYSKTDPKEEAPNSSDTNGQYTLDTNNPVRRTGWIDDDEEFEQIVPDAPPLEEEDSHMSNLRRFLRSTEEIVQRPVNHWLDTSLALYNESRYPTVFMDGQAVWLEDQARDSLRRDFLYAFGECAWCQLNIEHCECDSRCLCDDPSCVWNWSREEIDDCVMDGDGRIAEVRALGFWYEAYCRSRSNLDLDEWYIDYVNLCEANHSVFWPPGDSH